MMRMKRRNVVLDENLLDEAVRLGGERTYSATINRALAAWVKQIKVRQGLQFIGGSDGWDGDLAKTREDQPRMAEEKWWAMVQHQLSTVGDRPSSPDPTPRVKKGTRRGSR